MGHGGANRAAFRRGLRSADDAELCRRLADEDDPERCRAIRAVLAERWRPLLTPCARKLCSKSSGLAPCRYPACDRGWCDEFVGLALTWLLGRDGGQPGTAVEAACDPATTQDDLRALVSGRSAQPRWEDVQRSRHRTMGLPQRVDAFLRQCPHRDCFQHQLDEVLAGHGEARDAGAPAGLVSWAKALFFDACQSAADRIDHDRVARYLARDGAEFKETLGRSSELPAPLRDLIDAVDEGMQTMNEHRCLVCLPADERLAAARELIGRARPDADPAQVTEANAVAVAAAAWRVLGLEPMWYDRYIEATRQANHSPTARHGGPAGGAGKAQ
ncbi:hypothetical protein [Rhabdothermincola sediminis]|uniref:hypothetical protein n=1 Tax=Rhabdothermincola sediminis TaxID=2751370 RepID=UPI001AA02C11|nr:hypothetical protein [Rhabdothermincola sediminis]